MKNLVIMILLLSTMKVSGQEYFNELFGFKLGQYRKTLTKELGKPSSKDKLEDGFEYEQFLLKKDSSFYVVCEFAANQTDHIWSIQVSGSDNSLDLGFQGLRLGMNKEMVLKRFGEPTKKEDIGEYGQEWEYEKSNFSFEINTKGKLSSIKIRDISSEIYNTPDLKKIPTFDQLLSIITSDDNSKIADLLAPDIEIYYTGKVSNFSKSFKSELLTDNSKIYSLIKELSKDLKTVDTKNPDEYEENMRVQLGQYPKHVIKIKKGHQIKEIVLEYYWGKYVIREIKTK